MAALLAADAELNPLTVHGMSPLYVAAHRTAARRAAGDLVGARPFLAAAGLLLEHNANVEVLRRVKFEDIEGLEGFCAAGHEHFNLLQVVDDMRPERMDPDFPD